MRSDFVAALANVGKHFVNTFFINSTYALSRNTQFYPPVFTLHPKTARVKIRYKPTPCFIMRMGNVITRYGALSGNLADIIGHDK